MPSEEFIKSQGSFAYNVELAREAGRKGGAAKAKKQKEQKKMGEILKELMELRATPKMKQAFAKLLGTSENDDITIEMVMAAAQIKKSIHKEDTQAFNAVVDRIEGKPVAPTDINIQGNVGIDPVKAEKLRKAIEKRNNS